jgi:hypothetical protein
VPQRFPRPVMALIAAGAAVVSICFSAMPASAASVRQSEWWLSNLDVTTALLASQGSGVTVAVLSDGVDASQPDLVGVVTQAAAPAGAPQATGQFLGEQGTGIASLIAGHGHGAAGASGIIGVAPAAKILSVPVTLPADDPQLADPTVAALIPGAIAAGIRYAVSHGAEVIDLPIDPGQPGATGAGGDSAAAGGSQAEQAAVQYAIAHDVVLVAPAGDDETTTDAPNFPAAYPGVIAVGAFNDKFVKAPFSSHDSYVTVTAAGQGVTAAANNGGYQVMNSTAAASAVVSGIVALIRSRYPGLGVTAVRKALITSTVFRPPNGLLDGSGYGTVDAARAMAAAAVLATPRSRLAGTNAARVVAPSAIPAAVTASSLTPHLLRAGAISGAVLVLLLLLIGWYALVSRRRARRQRQSTAEWAQRPAQSRYPQARPDGDAAFGYLAAPLGVAGSIAASGVRDRGVFSAAGSGLGPPRMAGRDLTDSDTMPALGPASRAVSRRPLVTGAPPWEPAPAPIGDLPWAATPALPAGPSPAAALPAGPTAASGGVLPSSEPPLAGIPAAPPSAGHASGLWASPATGQPQADRRGAHDPGRTTASGNLPVRRPAARASLPPPDLADPNLSARDPASPSLGARAAASPIMPGRPVRPSTLAPWGSGDAASDTGPTDWMSVTGQAAAANHPAPADLPAGSAMPGPGDWLRQADWPPRFDRATADNQPGQAASGSPDGPATGTWVSAVQHGDASSRARFGDEPSWTEPDPPAEQGPARLTSAGLPIRQPRSAASAQRSPSGSLWEPAATRPRDYPQASYRRGSHGRHDADRPGRRSVDSSDGDVPEPQDSSGRHIFDWDLPASADGYPPPAE